MESVVPLSPPVTVHGFGNASELATHRGTMRLSPSLVLHHIYYVPATRINLCSTLALGRAGHAHYGPPGGTSLIITKDGKTVATGRRDSSGLIRFVCKTVSALAAVSQGTPLSVWHSRFCHLSPSAIRQLASSDDVKGLVTSAGSTVDACNNCLASKGSRLPFPVSESRALLPLELVRSDLLTLPVTSIGGNKHVITFVDNYSGELWCYCFKPKSDFYPTFVAFKAEVEKQSGQVLTRLRSYHGGNTPQLPCRRSSVTC